MGDAWVACEGVGRRLGTLCIAARLFLRRAAQAVATAGPREYS